MNIDALRAALDQEGVTLVVGHLADQSTTITGSHERQTHVGGDVEFINSPDAHGMYVDRKGRVWVMSTGRDQAITAGLRDQDGELTQAQESTLDALDRALAGEVVIEGATATVTPTAEPTPVKAVAKKAAPRKAGAK